MEISWLNNVILAVAITVALYGAWRLLGASAPRVDPGVLSEAVSAGAVLVDVRTPGEFAAGHVAGARNIPLGDLSRQASKLGSKKRPVLVYCRSGSRSRSAKGVLERAGFEQVIDLGSLRSAEQAMAAARRPSAAVEGAR